MNHSDVKPGMRVAYVPTHADGDLLHPDVELGTVSSVNAIYAFVQFDKPITPPVWLREQGVILTAMACEAADLVYQGEATP